MSNNVKHVHSGSNILNSKKHNNIKSCSNVHWQCSSNASASFSRPSKSNSSDRHNAYFAVKSGQQSADPRRHHRLSRTRQRSQNRKGNTARRHAERARL